MNRTMRSYIAVRIALAKVHIWWDELVWRHWGRHKPRHAEGPFMIHPSDLGLLEEMTGHNITRVYVASKPDTLQVD